ncbi:hypothetical protein GGG16DRAFT_83839 [Schizophyllum commune]|uniref:Tudor domain-containing protein n=1 Tax=Schizophyllum commune (strain H4-8 / FGSC 9210) TaxID=578458 RepID=D8PQV3_SCHCM|nr:uncharacterized protein SCHCODRAFT_02611116 [Schizophyllum commune H4-8]KAI5898097.1 hypothetical protein SCHCODRAFT_02611116 [Schizophyllum commune H4-8]
MDKADLEQYQLQLSQVETALEADPSNTELSELRNELKQLIDLTEQALAQASSSKAAETSRKSASATPSHSWSAGDECLAKYSGDGQWYPARITSVGGSESNRVYSIVFKGYNTTELVKAAEIKPLPANHQSAPITGKRKLSKTEEEERERKKKKNEKKLEVRAQKAKEQVAKQATWQKFTKKAEKKGVNIAGVSGTSIFKTPDNPMGRVGVTGSGKGMTTVHMPGKHKFEVRDEE